MSYTFVMNSRPKSRFAAPGCDIEAAASARDGSLTRRPGSAGWWGCEGCEGWDVQLSSSVLIVTALTTLQLTMCFDGGRQLLRLEVLLEKGKSKAHRKAPAAAQTKMNNNFALSGVAGHVVRHLRARNSGDLSRFGPLTFPTIGTTNAKERATEEAVFH